MAYVVRTKDNPGDVGRAADQQQGVDNETALYAAVLGPGPVATGGMVKQFVKQTGLVDNTATEIFTVTTTNEAGNTDGGVWTARFMGLVQHVGGSAGDNAGGFTECMPTRASRADGTGQVGIYSGSILGLAESEGGTTKGIASVTWTIAETSEYVTSVRVTVDLDGNAVTTATVVGMVFLWYNSFVTPPVITSAG
jgi:hypothetical protein